MIKTSRSKALFAQARNLYHRAVKEKKQAFYKALFLFLSSLPAFP